MLSQIAEITRWLEEAYGVPEVRGSSEPLDELIETVLSQNTSDVNSSRAMAELVRRFPTWEQVLRAPTSAVARAIRIGGLANIKAPRIKKILAHIRKRHGKLSLKFLRRMTPEEARSYLESLDGVGPKTAACVLLFSCRMPVFPVDTHIKRIGARLGWFSSRASDRLAHRIMQQMVPPEKMLSLHVNLIRHGRAVCRPQRPRCDVCVISNCCNYYRKQFRGS